MVMVQKGVCNIAAHRHRSRHRKRHPEPCRAPRLPRLGGQGDKCQGRFITEADDAGVLHPKSGGCSAHADWPIQGRPQEMCGGNCRYFRPGS